MTDEEFVEGIKQIEELSAYPRFREMLKARIPDWLCGVIDRNPKRGPNALLLRVTLSNSELDAIWKISYHMDDRYLINPVERRLYAEDISKFILDAYNIDIEFARRGFINEYPESERVLFPVGE